MSRYIISFGARAMDHIPPDQMADVGSAANAVVDEIIEAGVYVVAGGLTTEPATIVATDGAVTVGPYPDALGGFTIVDVQSRDEALKWAAKLAVACRCAQEVREFA